MAASPIFPGAAAIAVSSPTRPTAGGGGGRAPVPSAPRSLARDRTFGVFWTGGIFSVLGGGAAVTALGERIGVPAAFLMDVVVFLLAGLAARGPASVRVPTRAETSARPVAAWIGTEAAPGMRRP